MGNRHLGRLTGVVAAAGMCAFAGAQIGWTMRGFNTNRTGANQKETVLTQANVNTGQFGLIFTRPVDGQIYAQPLVVPGVKIPSKGTFNVVYVCTEHDSVYAFDADNPTNTSPFWQRTFTDSSNGVSSIPIGDLWGVTDIQPEVGITGTPAIDTVNGTLYVVVNTLEGDPNNDASYVQRLWALDLTTGATKFGGPVVLQASVPGNGDGTTGGAVSYNGRHNNQRPGLVLNNGKLYIAAASHGDVGPYHGWVLCYDATTLQQLAVYCSTPNGYDGGIWMSGQAPPVDGSGNLFLATGNGHFATGQSDYGDSVLKLNPTTLAIEDYFTPYNQATLDQNDTDLGVCGPILLPGTSYLVQGSKEGKLYLITRTNLGKFDSAGDNQIKQWWWACSSLIYAPPVYWQGGTNGNNLYVWSAYDVLKGFAFNGTTFNTTPFATGQPYVANPGGMLTITSNGSNAATALLWATSPYVGDANANTVTGTLHVFNPGTLAEIWNSRMVGGDDFGKFAKFNPPVVVNGKAYVPTFSNQLAVYGELPHVPPPAVGLTAEAGDKEVALSWQTFHGTSSFTVMRGKVGGPYTTIATVNTPNSSYDDTGLTDGATYAYRVVSNNAYGSSDPSNEASAIPAVQNAPKTRNGLTGYYYNDPGDGTFFRTLTMARVDPTVDFDWGGGSPGGRVGGTNFSVTWFGTIVAPATGYFTFQTASDDGVRLWVRGEKSIDDWTYHAYTVDNSPPVMLIAGKSYPIQLEYFQGPGEDLIHLYWSPTGQNNFQVVPTTSLFTYQGYPAYDAALDFSPNATLDGITYVTDIAGGDIGYRMESFAAELMPRYSTFALSGGVPFIIAPGFPSSLNFIEGDGQTLTTPVYQCANAYVLGCAVNGAQSGTFTFNYSDGSTTQQSVTFTDWGSATAQNGELLAKNFNLRHYPAGVLRVATSLFRYQIPVTSTKRLVSITLPNNSDIKIAAISLVR